MITYILYKCECCGKVFSGDEFDVSLDVVLDSIEDEDCYANPIFHQCNDVGSIQEIYGIAKIVGAKSIKSIN